MSERPTKRARGSYAKLICFNCRERRIKCQLPQDGSIQPSPDPQPPDKACQRCKQQGLECVVRKTTLGRPSLKRQTLPTPASTNPTEEFKSPSPETEDFVLLRLDNEANNQSKRTPRVGVRPTSLQLIGAIGKIFDLTSGLLARDPRFGSAIMESRDAKPPTLDKILNRDLAELLDEHLVWQRVYIPWLPRLTALYEETMHSDPEGGSSTLFLTALLASIALDTPSDRITEAHRQLRGDLQSIVYHAGQNVLFTLPKHVNTITALVLVHGYRPLALINSQQAAAHTLSGKLYPTLINAVQRELGFNSASSKLRDCLDGKREGDIPHLIIDTIQWCSTLSFKLSHDLEEIETHSFSLEESEVELKQSFDTVAAAVDLGLAASEYVFIFHVVRYHADYILTMRRLTANWNDLPKLTSIIQEYEALCDSRRKSFERHLTKFFYRPGRTEEGLTLSQLSNMELNQGRTNILGLAMFFAIAYGAQKISATSKPTHNQMIQLTKYYTDALHHEAGTGPESKTDVRKFLEQYGDAHMDGLERRLTDFINAATEVQLHGIAFVGPTRHTTSNVLMACKEIVENNAVRIKLDGELHHRADMQLILFQEAARRLEGMEADGGTPEAVARGSVFTASAKLIRNLHRIVSQWKRNYISKQQEPAQRGEQPISDGMPLAATSDPALPLYPGAFDSPLFTDDFLTDWDNWPRLDTAEFSNLFPFDFDPSGL